MLNKEIPFYEVQINNTTMEMSNSIPLIRKTLINLSGVSIRRVKLFKIVGQIKFTITTDFLAGLR